jgi:hypothetical protein
VVGAVGSATADRAPMHQRVFPSDMGLTFIYFTGTSNARLVRVLHGGNNIWCRTW